MRAAAAAARELVTLTVRRGLDLHLKNLLFNALLKTRRILCRKKKCPGQQVATNGQINNVCCLYILR